MARLRLAAAALFLRLAGGDAALARSLPSCIQNCRSQQNLLTSSGVQQETTAAVNKDKNHSSRSGGWLVEHMKHSTNGGRCYVLNADLETRQSMQDGEINSAGSSNYHFG